MVHVRGHLFKLYQNLFPKQKRLSVNQTSRREKNLAKIGMVIYGELTGSCSPTGGRWRGRGGAYFSPETLWRSVRVIEKEIELHVFTTHQE